MANYNHEILVNYLRDVYSMELLVRKIEDDIHSTREDIQCEQALVEKVESTPIPAEGNISPKKDITPYMIAGFLMQNDYLAMTEANTRITNYFVTADYINKYI